MEDIISTILDVVRAQHAATEGTDQKPFDMDDVVDMAMGVMGRPEEEGEAKTMEESIQKMVESMAPDIFPPRTFEQMDDSERTVSVTNMLENRLRNGFMPRKKSPEPDVPADKETEPAPASTVIPAFPSGSDSAASQEPSSYADDASSMSAIDMNLIQDSLSSVMQGYQSEAGGGRELDPRETAELNDLIYKNLMEVMGVQAPKVEFPFDRSQIVYGKEKTITEQLEEEGVKPKISAADLAQNYVNKEEPSQVSAWDLAQNAVNKDEEKHKKEPFVPTPVEKPKAKSASQLAAEAIARAQEEDRMKMEIERQAEALMAEAAKRGQDPMKFALHQQEILRYMEKNSDELVSFEDYEDLTPEEKLEVERQIYIEKQIAEGVDPDAVDTEVPAEYIPSELKEKDETDPAEPATGSDSKAEAAAPPVMTEEMLRMISQEVVRENSDMILSENAEEDMEGLTEMIFQNLKKMMDSSGEPVPQEDVGELIEQAIAANREHQLAAASAPAVESPSEKTGRPKAETGGMSAVEIARAAQKAARTETVKERKTLSAEDIARQAQIQAGKPGKARAEEENSLTQNVESEQDAAGKKESEAFVKEGADSDVKETAGTEEKAAVGAEENVAIDVRKDAEDADAGSGGNVGAGAGKAAEALAADDDTEMDFNPDEDMDIDIELDPEDDWEDRSGEESRQTSEASEQETSEENAPAAAPSDLEDQEEIDDQEEAEAQEEIDNQEEAEDQGEIEDSEEAEDEEEEDWDQQDPDEIVLGEHTQAEVDEAIANLATLGLTGEVYERAKRMLLLELAGSEAELDAWLAEQEKKKKPVKSPVEDDVIEDISDVDEDALERELELAMDEDFLDEDFTVDVEERLDQEDEMDSDVNSDQENEEDSEEEAAPEHSADTEVETAQKEEEEPEEKTDREETPKPEETELETEKESEEKADEVDTGQEEVTGKNEISTRKPFVLKNSATFMDQFEDFIVDTQENRKLSTGFRKLDAMLRYGLHKGTYFIDSQPQYLKNGFMQQLADRSAESGIDVLYISTELSRYDLMVETISRLSYEIHQGDPKNAVSAMDIMTGENGADLASLKDELNWYRGRISEHLFIVDQEAVAEFVESSGAQSAGDVLTELISSIVREGAHKPVVLIDNIENILSTEDSEDMKPLIKGMSKLAGELGIPILMSYGYAQAESEAEMNTWEREYHESIGNMCDVYLELGYTDMLSEDLSPLSLEEIREMVEKGDSVLINIHLRKNRRPMKAALQIQGTPKFNHFEE